VVIAPANPRRIFEAVKPDIDGRLGGERNIYIFPKAKPCGRFA
jgi:hypothetical protein